MTYAGSIDVSMQSHLVGWASQDREPTRVDIFVNNHLVGSAHPTIDRPDVFAAGFALRSGWEFTHPKPVQAHEVVHARFSDGSQVPIASGVHHAARLLRLTHGLDRETMTGLELGALDRPALGKDHWKVHFVDHASREDLIKKYGGSKSNFLEADKIVPVDIIWPSGSLKSKIADGVEYDFALASHVIEHVPDMLSWLEHIRDVLKDGGLLNLAIPDRDQTFDRYRELTGPAEIVDDYVKKLSRPCPRHVFDYVCSATPIGMSRVYHPLAAAQTAARVEESGEYFDAHCRTFNSSSFLDVCKVLVDAGLLRLKLAAFYPTVKGTNEFIVSLRVDRSASQEEIARTYADARVGLASLMDGTAPDGKTFWSAAV